MSNITMMPYTADERFEKTGKFNLRTKAFTGRTVTDCLLQAKQEMGADAIIVSKKTFKKGAWFGRWGGREVVEMTFGTYLPPTHPVANSNLRYGSPEPAQDAGAARLQELEAQIAGLKENLQNLSTPAPARRPAAPFVPASLQYDSSLSGQEAVARLVAAPPVVSPAPPAMPPAAGLRRPRRKEAIVDGPLPEQGYATLMQQLLESDIAAPLAKQLVSEIPAGMGGADAATYLRTLLSQRLRIANGIDALPANGKMRLLAFVGTTGVGKTTTIAKLTARFALLEKRKVGVITLDTHRIGAAEQLQKYGDILRVPVKIARDKLELIQHINDFAAEGKEIVMLDTAGRSPNEMIPLGETAHLFEGVGAVQKYLTLPAVLGQRDMENIVTKFQNIFTPDAVILTKLDEASDHTCFGRLLTLQAKYGLPLAYVTTGQKVPDDIVLPDAHAIASRILSTPLM